MIRPIFGGLSDLKDIIYPIKLRLLYALGQHVSSGRVYPPVSGNGLKSSMTRFEDFACLMCSSHDLFPLGRTTAQAMVGRRLPPKSRRLASNASFLAAALWRTVSLSFLLPAEHDELLRS